MEQTIEATEAGVIADAVAGQYAGPEMLAYAVSKGFKGDGSETDSFLLRKAQAVAAAWDWSAGPEWPTDEYLAFDSINDLMLEAEDWLADRAPAGFGFGWREGDFLLATEQFWDEEDQV